MSESDEVRRMKKKNAKEKNESYVLLEFYSAPMFDSIAQKHKENFQ